MKAIWLSFREKNIKIIIVLSIILMLLLLFSALRDRSKVISLTQADILVKKDIIVSVYQDKNWFYLNTKEKHYRILKDAVNKKFIYNRYKVELKYDKKYFFNILLLLIIIFLLFRLKSGKTKENTEITVAQKEFQKENIYSTKNSIKAIKSAVTFDDIAGMSEVKEDLQEIIEFLKEPKKYKKLDIRLPKGVLLIGPPGVGKTFIAKAVAGEASVPFFYQSGATFVHLYVGTGAASVKDLFAKAKRMAPSIVFIDEIDAVGKRRGELRNDERETTLNQLLTEMDGFEDSSGVIVIGATNNVDVLDDALLRSGRFDRRVYIPLPDLEDRQKTLELYLSKKKHTVDIEQLAISTVGFNNAGLSTITNEAALYAFKNGRDNLSDDDFEAVKDKVLKGKRKIASLTYKEREIEAIYQASKAIVATWYDVEFQKIGIVTTILTQYDNEIISQNQMLNRIKIYLAGFIATKKVYKEQFTNSADDIKMAKNMINNMLDRYSMGNDFSSSESQKDEVYKSLIQEIETLVDKLDIAIDKVSIYLLQYENITQSKTKEIIREIF